MFCSESKIISRAFNSTRVHERNDKIFSAFILLEMTYKLVLNGFSSKFCYDGSFVRSILWTYCGDFSWFFCVEMIVEISINPALVRLVSSPRLRTFSRYKMAGDHFRKRLVRNMNRGRVLDMIVSRTESFSIAKFLLSLRIWVEFGTDFEWHVRC